MGILPNFVGFRDSTATEAVEPCSGATDEEHGDCRLYFRILSLGVLVFGAIVTSFKHLSESGAFRIEARRSAMFSRRQVDHQAEEPGSVSSQPRRSFREVRKSANTQVLKQWFR